MKNALLILSLAFAAVIRAATAQPITVIALPTGELRSPTNLFAANSDAIAAVMATNGALVSTTNLISTSNTLAAATATAQGTANTAASSASTAYTTANTAQATADAALPKVSGIGTGLTLTDSMTIRKSSGSNGPIRLQVGGPWVDPDLPTFPVLVITAGNSGPVNVDLMPYTPSNYALRYRQVVDFCPGDLHGPTLLTNQSWFGFGAQSDGTGFASSDHGSGGSYQDFYMQTGGGNVGIGKFGISGGLGISPVDYFQVRPGNSINWGLNVTGGGIRQGAYTDAGTYLPMAYYATSHAFSPDGGTTVTLGVSSSSVFSYYQTNTASLSSIAVPLIVGPAAPVASVILNATKFSTSVNTNLVNASVVTHRLATDNNFALDTITGGLAIKAYTDAFVELIMRLRGKAVHITTDGDLTQSMVITNATTLFRGTKFSVSYDGTQIPALFGGFRPASNVVISFNNNGTNARISSVTDAIGDIPLIVRTKSLLISDNGETSYPVTYTNGVLTVPSFSVTVATNKPAGQFTLASGTVTVGNTSVTAGSVIHVTLRTASGTRAGNPDIVPQTGVGFAATGAVSDNGTYNYWIENNTQ